VNQCLYHVVQLEHWVLLGPPTHPHDSLSDQPDSPTHPHDYLSDRPDPSTHLHSPQSDPPDPHGSLSDKSEPLISRCTVCLVMMICVVLVAVAIPYFIPSSKLHKKPTYGEMIVLNSNLKPDLCIIKRVARKCQQLGHVLGLREIVVHNLWDKSDSSAITDKCGRTIQEWLDGQGTRPVTWNTFLEKLKLLELSRELTDILQS